MHGVNNNFIIPCEITQVQLCIFKMIMVKWVILYITTDVLGWWKYIILMLWLVLFRKAKQWMSVCCVPCMLLTSSQYINNELQSHKPDCHVFDCTKKCLCFIEEYYILKQNIVALFSQDFHGFAVWLLSDNK